MLPEEVRGKLLSSDDFVLGEVERLRYLYRLKRTIRANLGRTEGDLSESVAEHVYGMHVLATYFMKVEEVHLDPERVRQLITFHDAGEIETGDVSTHQKTDADRSRERAALLNVVAKVPATLAESVQQLVTEYDEQRSEEARFVKAIDKLEPVLQFYDESHRDPFTDLQFTEEDLHRTKKKYIECFPYMMRFYEVLAEEFSSKDYYYRPR